jgi:hypothetical protein
MVKLRVSFLRVAMAEPTAVGPGDDKDASSSDSDILDEKNGGDEPRRFIGVGPAHDQKMTALFLALEYVHFCVSMRVLKNGKVIAEHLF